jgi:hypothetical protein
LALRQEFARLVDHEEAPVAGEAEVVDLHRGHGEAAEGFDGIEEQAGDVHGG